MEEVKNLTQDEVLEMIKDFPVQPTRNKVIITVNVDEYEPDEINLTGDSFAEVQYVIAVGDYCKDIEAGQKVLLDLRKMMTQGNQIEIDPLEVNGRMYAFINDGMIKAIDNR